MSIQIKTNSYGLVCKAPNKSLLQSQVLQYPSLSNKAVISFLDAVAQSLKSWTLRVNNSHFSNLLWNFILKVISLNPL